MNTRDLLFTAALGAALTASADTSWLIRPYASASGRTQLFASRADKPRPLAVRAVLPPKGKGYKSLRFGDKSGFTYAGINEFGVAATFSGAGPTGDKPNAPKKGERLYPGNAAVDLVLRSSKSAKQGVEALRKVARRGLIEHSMIILIADAKQAFVVEAAARHIAVYELSLAYTVHTHQWKLPGMEDASMRIPIGENTNAQREWVAATGLAKARKNDRKISVAEAIAVSRLNPADVKRDGIRSAPSGDAALDACLFEIDPKYPGMLSCVYAAIGPQRHTVYLPIPLAALGALPAELADAQWAEFGNSLRKKSSPDAPVASEIIDLEKCLYQELNDIRFKAAQLLAEKKTAEARQLLIDMLQRQSQEVLKFMRERR